MNKEQIVVNCEVGYPDSMKYNLDSIPAGTHNFNLQIYDSLGLFIEESSTIIIATDNSAQYYETLKVLLIGDSYTSNGSYLLKIQELYNLSNCYPVKFLGTNYFQSGIYHEGYSGRGWYFFGNNTLSPFLFDGLLDFEIYFNQVLNGEIPDIITVFLGINDIGLVDPSTIETIDMGIDSLIFNYPRMEKVINSLVQTLPDVKIGIVLTPPTNEREYSYSNPESPDYLERKKMNHRLCQRYIDYFKSLNNPDISVIPVNVNIDTYFGFDEPNGFDTSASIHPNSYGYGQIGHSIYGWLKYQTSKFDQIIKFSNIIITHNRFSLDISWDYPIPGLTYNIYRSKNPYGDFSIVHTTLNRYYTDTDIMGAKGYFYKITAENSQQYRNFSLLDIYKQ